MATTTWDNSRDMFLTTGEAAEYLRLSTQTMDRFRATGEGPPYIKLGNGKRSKVIYRRSDIDAWLECHLRVSPGNGRTFK